MLLPVLFLAGCATPARLPGVVPDVNLGTVRVDSVQRVAIATGFVNQVSGPIELFACGPGGKRHESIFVIESSAVELQAGLLLLGCKAGPPMQGLGMGPPQGSRVRVWVDADNGAGSSPRPAGEYILSVKTRKPMTSVGWIFTGSIVEKGEFKALAEESYVTTFWDPWAILNLDHGLGADDESFVVNTNMSLSLHAPATFYFQADP